jgi:hypothetical protein
VNKSSTIVKLVLYYIIVTMVATSLGATVNGLPVWGYSIPAGTPDIFNFVEFMWGMVQIFFGLFSFSVDGIPVFVSLIFIWLPAMYILLWLISLIRGVS